MGNPVDDIQVRRNSKGVIAIRVKADSMEHAHDRLTAAAKADGSLYRFSLIAQFVADGSGWWIARKA